MGAKALLKSSRSQFVSLALNPRVVSPYQGKVGAHPIPASNRPAPCPGHAGISVHASRLRIPETPLPTSLSPIKPPLLQAWAPTPHFGRTLTPRPALWFFPVEIWSNEIPKRGRVKRGGVATARALAGLGMARAEGCKPGHETPRPTTLGEFPPTPHADRFTWLEDVGPACRRAGHARKSPDSHTAWPGRRRPLVAMVCNYSLRAHRDIATLNLGCGLTA